MQRGNSWLALLLRRLRLLDLLLLLLLWLWRWILRDLSSLPCVCPLRLMMIMAGLWLHCAKQAWRVVGKRLHR
jgi:hypothetical protein